MLRKHAYGRNRVDWKGGKSLEKRKNKKDMANFLFLFFFVFFSVSHFQTIFRVF